MVGAGHQDGWVLRRRRCKGNRISFAALLEDVEIWWVVFTLGLDECVSANTLTFITRFRKVKALRIDTIDNALTISSEIINIQGLLFLCKCFTTTVLAAGPSGIQRNQRDISSLPRLPNRAHFDDISELCSQGIDDLVNVA